MKVSTLDLHLSLIVVFLALTVMATQSEDTCGNPEYAEIKDRLLQHYDIFDSFYKLPRFAETSRLPRQNISRSAAFLAESDTGVCQTLRNQPIGIEGRDPCPGEWVLSRDPNRVPCLQREMLCLCAECLLPPELAGRPGNTPQCQPVYNYVPVMRRLRNPDTNLDQWTYALDPVVVACTCAGRRVNQVVATRF
ncbi:hypothetical protein RRG08_061074 [Elysia crispata]|uniref:Uncharacterized protein n=1 Tax=Elysia crispata TaxID=231223 RepID=A0AAE0YWA7_9GAST|nr:hypothetical protein RRG08_061074 [Elysia crispata]